LNCNSGASYIGRYLVYIWRSEEYIRVLIHELIHAFGGDELLINSGDLNHQLSEHFCLNKDQYININETYTETLATIINVIYRSIVAEKKDIYEMFMIEFGYSLLVLISILKHFDYNNIQQLDKSKLCKTLPQKTSVFNYYIMKPFMLFNMNKFLKLGKGNKCIEHFKLKCKKEFMDLVLDNFNNDDIKNIVNFLLLEQDINTKSLSMVYFN